MSNELTNYLLRHNVLLTGTEGIEEQAHYAALMLAEKDEEITHLTAERDQALACGGELQQAIAAKDELLTEKDAEIARLRGAIDEIATTAEVSIVVHDGMYNIYCIITDSTLEILKKSLAATNKEQESK